MNRIAAVLMLLALSTPAIADDKSIRKEIQAEYVKYDQAVVKGMSSLAEWCEARLTQDFVMQAGPGKPMTRKAFMASIQQLVKNPDTSWKGIKSQKTTIDKLTDEGGDPVASITVRGAFTTTDTTGEYGPKGKDHRLTLIRTYRETWTKSEGEWKIKKSEMIGGSMLIDGKPANDKK